MSRRPARPLAAAAAACFLASLIAAAALAADDPTGSIRLRHGDGQEEELATIDWGGVEYLSASDASRIVAATKRWRPETMRLLLRAEQHDVRLTLQNSVAIVDEKPVVMPGPLRVRDGVFWLPLEFVANRLAPLAGRRVAWAAAAREFLLDGGGANVRGLSLERRGGDAALRIGLSAYLPHDAKLANPRELVVTLRGGVLPPESLRVVGDDEALVAGVVGEAVPGGAVIRVSFAADVAAARAEYEARSRSVRVLLARSEEGARALADPYRSQGDEGSGGEDGTSGPGSGSRPAVVSIVLDPGHGGADDGIIGASGVREKDVALSIALAARPLIEQRLGIRVILTRDVDAPLSPEERAQFANAQPGAIYISIHCGAWSDAGASGFEASYYGAPPAALSDPARAAGRPAWVRSVDGGPREVRFVPWDLAPTRFTERSGELAQIMSAELEQALSVRGRGVRRGRIAALRGVQMPGILIEVGLLSNADEEARLGSANFLAQVAEAIARGVGEFSGRRASADGAPAGTIGLRAEPVERQLAAPDAGVLGAP